MKIKIYLFFITLFTFLSACNEDMLREGTLNGSPDMDEDGYFFDFQVETPGVATRTVDFTPTASIRINQVWIGVFDADDGKCIDKVTKSLDYKTISTNNEIHEKLLKIDLTAPETKSNRGYVIVSLANYIGVMDENMDPEDNLEARLMRVETWKDFNSIAVDAASAYSSPHNTTTPVLAGFLYKRDYSTQKTHIKIDQFAEQGDPNDNSIQLSPATVEPYVMIEGGPEGYKIEGETVLKMRRLVANMNVIIELTDKADNLLLTEVTYKRFNMPKAVGIIERKTTGCTWNQQGDIIPGYFGKVNINDSYNPELSPNFADKQVNPADWYYDDTDWQYGNINGFSFQHFANKHWSNYAQNGNGQLIDSDGNTVNREELNSNKAFKALVGENGTQEDFNNYASYFIVKMHLVDQSSGRAFEAEYTIHEGNTSDEVGDPIDETFNTGRVDRNGDPIMSYKGNTKDFVVARNLNYTYHIYIDGVESIWHNVYTDEGTDYNHSDGQGGKMWKINYMGNDGEGDCSYDHNTGNFNHAVSSDGGLFENCLIITNYYPDLSFRLYGYNTDSETIEGYNYNFPDQSFQWLNTLWPESAGSYSHYFKDYDELMNPSTAKESDIPDNILNGLRIIDPTNPDHMGYETLEGEERRQHIIEKTWDIKGFIFAHHIDKTSQDYNPELEDKELPESDYKKYHVWIDKSNIGEQPKLKLNDFIRVIYIGDRKGKKDYNIDGCTTLVNIYAIAQYPPMDPNTADDKLDIELRKDYNLVCDKNYNILDQYLDDFTVRALQNGLAAEKDYSYHLYIDNIDCTEYGSYNAQTGLYTYSQVPVALIKGSSANVSLQAVSLNEDYYDSEKENIGTITLKDPNEILSLDWNQALNFYGAASQNPFATGSYLSTFFLGTYGSTSVTVKDISVSTENNNNSSQKYFKIAGSNWFTFKVYKPCKVIARARTQNIGSSPSRRLDIRLNEYTNIIKEGTLSTTSMTGNIGTWTDISGNITTTSTLWKDYEGNDVYLVSANGGIDFISLSIEPLE